MHVPRKWLQPFCLNFNPVYFFLQLQNQQPVVRPPLAINSPVGVNALSDDSLDVLLGVDSFEVLIGLQFFSEIVVDRVHLMVADALLEPVVLLEHLPFKSA